MIRFLLLILVLFLVACDVLDPEARRAALHLPPAGFKGNAIQGNKLFDTNCSSCHGGAAAGTTQGPALVHNIYRPSHHADYAIHMAVRDGVRQHHWHFGDMPAIPQITPEEVAHIIAYLRREQSKAGIID